MSAPAWRVGAFAERYPNVARDIGRTHKVEAVAARLLYETAGVASSSAVSDAGYGGPYMSAGPGESPRGCCGAPCATANTDSACSRGTCEHCGPAESDFAAIYPEAAQEMDACHAFGAAVRDILADPDVEDVAGAIEQAMSLHAKGALAKLYAPHAPAKKMPDGSNAPARCPICGATVCPSCGCSCCCVASAHEKPAAETADE
jgi:hypothetical protein